MLDIVADRSRRRESYLDLIVYEGDWCRPDRGWGWAWAAPITGPFGKVLERAVQAHMEGGRGRDITDEDTGRKLGETYPIRWDRMLQMIQPAWNMSQLLAGKEGPGRNAPLYRDPVDIGGLDSVAWSALRSHVGLDAVLVEKQALGVALASAGVGVVLDDPRYPPAVQAFAPHEVTFLPHPWNPRMCAVAIHHRLDGRVSVSDVTDHRRPVFGVWRSLADWRAGVPPLARTMLSGPDYPFKWAGEVLTHIIPVQGRAAPGCLQPPARSLRQLTIDTILELGWVRLTARVGSFNRVVLASEGAKRPEGLEELSLNPMAVGAVWGGKAPAIVQVGHSVDAAQKLYEIAMADIQSHLSMLDGDLRLRATESGVQSGRAIEIEREGVEDYARDQMRIQAPADARIVGLICAVWNWQVDNRLVDPGLVGLDTWARVPEERPTISYPLRWSQAERRTIAERMEKTDPVGAECIRRGLSHTSSDDRAAVFVDLRTAARQRAELAREGYGVPEATLYSDLPAAQDDTVTYTPPADVADTAARGLRLQSEFKSRWGGLAVRDLLARGRRLQAQEPFTLGEVRALGEWLDAHASGDGAGPGVWGDDGDPSGAWIAFCSQGGQPGQVWRALVMEG